MLTVLDGALHVAHSSISQYGLHCQFLILTLLLLDLLRFIKYAYKKLYKCMMFVKAGHGC